MESEGAFLVIEGDPDIRSLLATSFSPAGFRVLTAHFGAAGLEAAACSEPDLIPTDLTGMDLEDIEFLPRLRKISGAPIIVISAGAEPADELIALASGASAYLTKPFRLRWLRDLVSHF
ncbi:DNA-binding response OmpR family regulator [Arthrobacter sp. V4I6]|uniref:response regulator n=1 Tax=unclassified Arthrobacter TaxID=235627 RepID=UPI002783FB4B|nr:MULTISPECIES: response regulator [unclassified Arthrobacter]MDQ0819414.1 DNA-binding response OmpR family regulator [Arthrobacter sp. V1I7]MDQ0853598.1 DNA-binding response OmpR family regulator [Arthrobacter sp. V4I6]